MLSHFDSPDSLKNVEFCLSLRVMQSFLEKESIYTVIMFLKDVVIFCKRNVYSLGLRDLDMKVRKRGMETATMCFLTLFWASAEASAEFFGEIGPQVYLEIRLFSIVSKNFLLWIF